MATSFIKKTANGISHSPNQILQEFNISPSTHPFPIMLLYEWSTDTVRSHVPGNTCPWQHCCQDMLAAGCCWYSSRGHSWMIWVPRFVIKWGNDVLNYLVRCNRLKPPLARWSVVQCYYMGHNGHGINLYGVRTYMTLMTKLHAGVWLASPVTIDRPVDRVCSRSTGAKDLLFPGRPGIFTAFRIEI